MAPSRRKRCPCAGRHSLWVVVRRWVGLLLLSLASALAPTRRKRCPCAGRHLLWVVVRRRVGFSGFALASAWRLHGASVAPVRGGTYFLCRRKESKQRKRANTARSCVCLRAPNRPSASRGNFSVSARCQRLESAPHPLQSPVTQPAAANGLCRPGGKLCAGRSASHVSALTTPIVLFSPE